ncbi:MAG TPA: putative O-glycosylation ligase, exosortase A system-associated [Steroidobacteraceae bacterium]|nr:putative O-glycosylation ligase, exosortase A system-associated [Steroidobacteraceae bacterium]
MRDLIVTAAIVGSLPLILWRPWIGILMWSWIAYMNPHRLTWGFAYNMPFAAMVAAATFAAIVFSRDKNEPMPWSGTVGLWIVFVLWLSFTSIFALNGAEAWVEWERCMKIQLFAMLTVWLIQGKDRINWLVLVIVVSIGFFGIKGGLFALRTAGASRVMGPPDSYIADNNTLALALIMIVPLMRYYASVAPKKWLRWGMYAAMPLTAISVLASQSRGALLATCAMLAFMVAKTKKRGWLVLVIGVGFPVLINWMPDTWTSRMHTMQTYEQDGSAMGRISAWKFAWNLALHRPIVGGGFETFTPELFRKYAPTPDVVQGPHSIYFEVLGEHGFVGLILFLSLFIIAFRRAGAVVKMVDSAGPAAQEMAWARELCAMLQVSIVGYAVGGAFLGLAYFDLPYHILALILVTSAHVQRRLAAKPAEASAPPAVALHPPPVARRSAS